MEFQLSHQTLKFAEKYVAIYVTVSYTHLDSDLKLHKKVYEELMSEAAVAAEKN